MYEQHARREMVNVDADRKAMDDYLARFDARRAAETAPDPDSDYAVTVDGRTVELNPADFRTLASRPHPRPGGNVGRAMLDRQRVEIAVARNYGVNRTALVAAVVRKDRENAERGAGAYGTLARLLKL